MIDLKKGSKDGFEKKVWSKNKQDKLDKNNWKRGLGL